MPALAGTNSRETKTRKRRRDCNKKKRPGRATKPEHRCCSQSELAWAWGAPSPQAQALWLWTPSPFGAGCWPETPSCPSWRGCRRRHRRNLRRVRRPGILAGRRRAATWPGLGRRLAETRSRRPRRLSQPCPLCCASGAWPLYVNVLIDI